MRQRHNTSGRVQQSAVRKGRFTLPISLEEVSPFLFLGLGLFVLVRALLLGPRPSASASSSSSSSSSSSLADLPRFPRPLVLVLAVVLERVRFELPFAAGTDCGASSGLSETGDVSSYVLFLFVPRFPLADAAATPLVCALAAAAFSCCSRLVSS